VSDPVEIPIPDGRSDVAGSTPGGPCVVSSRSVYEGKVVNLRVDEITLPQGGTAIREVVEHPGAVVVAAVNEAGEVYLVRQYRHAVRRDLLELPAGALEEGEEPLFAARRELGEEAGLEASEWTALGCFYSSPGFANERLYAFLARGLSSVESDPDFDEDLTVVTYPLEDLFRHLADITDAKTLATLLLVRQQLDAATR
jgi:ADP-ribose pyrophosphatase